LIKKEKATRGITVVKKEKCYDEEFIAHLYFHIYLIVWRSTDKTFISSTVALQKRAIRIMNTVGYYEHTHPLFHRSHVMKFNDLVYYKIMQTM